MPFQIAGGAFSYMLAQQMHNRIRQISPLNIYETGKPSRSILEWNCRNGWNGKDYLAEIEEIHQVLLTGIGKIHPGLTESFLT